MTASQDKLVLALPKGRILKEVMPLVEAAGIVPEAAFNDSNSRQLTFATNVEGLTIIRVRAFDAATFVAFGAADFGVVGSDVIAEFEYRDLYAPVDLGVGKCHLSLAMPVDRACHYAQQQHQSHVRVATKYPRLTQKFFAARGQQAECVKLSGAMELAPSLGLAGQIVDLVSTGSTLKANHLQEVETLMQISSRLVVSRPSLKTRPALLTKWIDRFRLVAAGG